MEVLEIVQRNDRPTASSDPVRSSAAKLMDLFRVITGNSHEFGLKDLALRANLSESSTHRLLQEMMRAGLVERSGGRKYKLGRELYRIASEVVSKFDWNRTVRPVLEELGRQWQETTVACAYSPPRLCGVILDVVNSPHPLRAAVERGGIVALPWGSLGRAILASLSSGEVEAVLRRETYSPLNRTPRPPRDELLAELALIRSLGFARHYDPENGIAGIASPIFGPDGVIFGCVGVTMPAIRFDPDSCDSLAASVCQAARALTQQAAISEI